MEKEEEIMKLREEVQRLKSKLRRKEQSITEGVFGSSTPSSQIPVKANTPGEKKAPGQKLGHPGNGRKRIADDAIDERVSYSVTETICPDCGNPLHTIGTQERIIKELEPPEVKTIALSLQRKRCSHCGRELKAKATGILPKNLYGNKLLGYIAHSHYVMGIPLGRLEEQLGVGSGSMLKGLHQLSGIFKEIPEQLLLLYRQSPVKHADETVWRIDGRNGYAWSYSTKELIIFMFRTSRSGKIVREALGDEALPGVLVVDRYAGYNKSPCLLQYCYAHLHREVEDLGKEFAKVEEVQQFVAAFAPLPAEAMHLRTMDIDDNEYYRRARLCKEQILCLAQAPAKHAGILRIQQIFIEKEHRLFHWVYDRRIPAENNQAERDVRKVVISRKVSFGSHSLSAAKTREILMTVLWTLKKKYDSDVLSIFTQALDAYALDKEVDLFNLLFHDFYPRE
ncbi:MAG: IS66 family transposase [Bacteroidetes bacterium]|nr:IS66 family transposase [Bacteroidota bacterium]